MTRTAPTILSAPHFCPYHSAIFLFLQWSLSLPHKFPQYLWKCPNMSSEGGCENFSRRGLKSHKECSSPKASAYHSVHFQPPEITSVRRAHEVFFLLFICVFNEVNISVPSGTFLESLQATVQPYTVDFSSSLKCKWFSASRVLRKVLEGTKTLTLWKKHKKKEQDLVYPSIDIYIYIYTCKPISLECPFRVLRQSDPLVSYICIRVV